MATHRPFSERVLEAIVVLSNRDKGYVLQGKADADRDNQDRDQTPNNMPGVYIDGNIEINEDILTFMRDKSVVHFDDFDKPHLTDTGRNYYNTFLDIVKRGFAL